MTAGLAGCVLNIPLVFPGILPSIWAYLKDHSRTFPNCLVGGAMVAQWLIGMSKSMFRFGKMGLELTTINFT